MKIGIIGSAGVAQTVARGLIQIGHAVMISSRDKTDIKSPRFWGQTIEDYLKENPGVKFGTLAEAAEFGEILINATNGVNSIEALEKADAYQHKKILIDLANELEFTKDSQVRSLASYERCLGEAIQNKFPNLEVVKTLNTVNAQMMVNPQQLKLGDHTMIVTGNSDSAKSKVSDLLKQLGWIDIVDLGNIFFARGQEMTMGLWISLFMNLKNPMINIKIVR